MKERRFEKVVEGQETFFTFLGIFIFAFSILNLIVFSPYASDKTQVLTAFSLAFNFVLSLICSAYFLFRGLKNRKVTWREIK